MPWTIDGPSSEQLGYLRPTKLGRAGSTPSGDRQPGRRLWPWVVVVAGVLLVVAAVSFAVAGESRPQIATKAVGSWREVHTPEHYVLRLQPEAADSYEVDYPRADGEIAMLRDHDIVILRWRDSTVIICTLTYDPKSDRLIATTSHGRVTLERMS
jgi:hypothetical protein